MTEPSTPLMRQYAAVKKEHPTALLFFRLGDFYELFFDDAILAAKELQITLTSRNKEKGIAVPMCGVPYHAAEGYIGKLIRKGFKVAICEQMEDARLAKKLVRREVTRVVTPAFSRRWRRLESGSGLRLWICRRGSFGLRSLLARGRCGGCRRSWSSCGLRSCCMDRRRRCSRAQVLRGKSCRASLGRTAESLP